MELTQEIVRVLLGYNPDTGALTWRDRLRNMFASEWHWKAWNTKYAGKPAFQGTHPDGYKIGCLLRRKHLAHRVIWLRQTGKLPEFVDHINHVRDDNRWANLRGVNSTDNARNRSVSTTNNSGRIGVGWYRRRGMWQAQIKENYKNIHLGYFDNFDDAVAARAAAEIKYKYHQNHGKR